MAAIVMVVSCQRGLYMATVGIIVEELAIGGMRGLNWSAEVADPPTRPITRLPNRFRCRDSRLWKEDSAAVIQKYTINIVLRIWDWLFIVRINDWLNTNITWLLWKVSLRLSESLKYSSKFETYKIFYYQTPPLGLLLNRFSLSL